MSGNNSPALEEVDFLAALSPERSSRSPDERRTSLKQIQLRMREQQESSQFRALLPNSSQGNGNNNWMRPAVMSVPQALMPGTHALVALATAEHRKHELLLEQQEAVTRFGVVGAQAAGKSAVISALCKLVDPSVTPPVVGKCGTHGTVRNRAFDVKPVQHLLRHSLVGPTTTWRFIDTPGFPHRDADSETVDSSRQQQRTQNIDDLLAMLVSGIKPDQKLGGASPLAFGDIARDPSEACDVIVVVVDARDLVEQRSHLFGFYRTIELRSDADAALADVRRVIDKLRDLMDDAAPPLVVVTHADAFVDGASAGDDDDDDRDDDGDDRARRTVVDVLRSALESDCVPKGRCFVVSPTSRGAARQQEFARLVQCVSEVSRVAAQMKRKRRIDAAASALASITS